jgi:hypothetical protein
MERGSWGFGIVVAMRMDELAGGESGNMVEGASNLIAEYTGHLDAS